VGDDFILKQEIESMKVSASTNPKSLAWAISAAIQKSTNKSVELITCGAAATLQAQKAIAIARGIVAVNGMDIVVKPGFKNGEIDGQERTMMRFEVLIS
jgi:stage V sporulation protein S